MALMTGEQYVESIRKMNMQIYMFGEKIENPVDHPILRPSLNSVKMTYDLASMPEYEDLMTATSHITGEKINLYPDANDAAATAAHDAFIQDNNCYNLATDGSQMSVTNPQGTLYMTANSASGSKYYELISAQQDYIANRSQNWLPSYSIINMTENSFKITTYQIADDGSVQTIDDTFTINKSSN